MANLEGLGGAGGGGVMYDVPICRASRTTYNNIQPILLTIIFFFKFNICVLVKF